MFGGIVPPITPPHGGGGHDEKFLESKEQDELGLRRKKILEQDDEDWILFIHNFIVSNHLN